MYLMSGNKEYEKFCRIRHIEEQGILNEVVIEGIANDLQCQFFEVIFISAVLELCRCSGRCGSRRGGP